MMSKDAPMSLDEGVKTSGSKTEEFWQYLRGATPGNHPYGEDPKRSKEED